MNTSQIITRDRIKLTDSQLRLIKGGWGKEAVENTIVQQITYLSDGLKVNGYLAFPSDKSKTYPSIIWCRGGFGEAGVIDSFNAQGIFGQLASWGYVVFASQYRGNAGSEGVDEFGGSDINDVLNLIPLAKEVTEADENVWGIEGWSRGGMMTYLALTKTNIFKAAVVTGAVANLRCNAGESVFMNKFYEKILGKFGSESFDEKCRTRSIINSVDKISKTTNLLIMHGTADNRVLPHDSIEVANCLLKLERPFRLLLMENGDHFLKNHRQEIDRQRKEWFAKYLK